MSERFEPGSAERMNWENHRWVRFRSMMALVERLLAQLRSAFGKGGDAYEPVVTNGSGDYCKWDGDDARAKAFESVKQLADLGFPSEGFTFQSVSPDGAAQLQTVPQREPELVVRPRM